MCLGEETCQMCLGGREKRPWGSAATELRSSREPGCHPSSGNGRQPGEGWFMLRVECKDTNLREREIKARRLIFILTSWAQSRPGLLASNLNYLRLGRPWGGRLPQTYFCNCRLYLNSGMLAQVVSRPTSPLLTFTDIYPGSITPEGVLMCITNTRIPITRQNCYWD